MTPNSFRAPNAPRASLARDEGGFIILGGIVLVLAILVVGVLLGKVFRIQYPDSYIEATAARHWVLDDTRVELGGRTVAQLRRGDTVWATRLPNGDIAVTADSTGSKVVGFIGGDILSEIPPAAN